MQEKDLIYQLLRKLKTIPHSWWYKIPDPARCPKCGCISVVSKRPFDIVGCLEGKFVAIEVKTEKFGHLQPHQKAALELVAHAHGVSAVIVKKKIFNIRGQLALITGSLKKIVGVWN